MPRTKTFKDNIKKIYNPQQQQIILNSLNYYFLNNIETLRKIDEIINDSNGRITMALLDYFVTIFSKKNKSFILKGTEPYYFHLDYKANLKSYSKKNFEPFKRNSKTFTYNYGKISFDTTVSQLNFLKWAVKNSIIEYIEENIEKITEDYKLFCKEKKEKKEKKKST